MAKSKAELLAEKMKQQRVGKTAFEAGAKPIIETNPPATEQETPQETQDAPKVEETTVAAPVEAEPVKTEQKEEKAAKTAKPAKEAPKQQKKAAPEKKVEESAEPAAPTRVLDRIKKRKRVEKKTNAYYLSVANIEKLAEAAEAADMSPSTFLDDILTAVFSE